MEMKRKEENVACSIPCNLCESTNVDELCLKDRDGGYLRTVICKECGLIWSDPRPTEEELKEYYANKYRREYKGIYEPKRKHIYRDARWAKIRIGLIRDIFRKDQRMLDIGSGSGVYVSVLRKLGYDAHGIEPDVGHATYSRDVMGLPVRNCYAEDLESDERYDVISISHVLEHMTDPCGKLAQISKHLTKDGFFVVDVPNAEDLKQDPHNRYHKAHVYTYNPETMEGLGRKAGLKVYKKIVAPRKKNGNITIIFQKDDNPVEFDPRIPGNYEKITRVLDAHTELKHYLTLAPYLKFVHNIFKFAREQLVVRNKKDLDQIIDQVVAGM